jgi:hypothetical protein
LVILESGDRPYSRIRDCEDGTHVIFETGAV